MKIFRHQWLALLLAFCLPAQALAAVLVECQQHAAESLVVSHVQTESSTIHADPHAQSAAATPDCHGTPTDSKSDASAEPSEPVNSAPYTCFHCSGTCQNFKPLSLAVKSQMTQILDTSAFARLNLATEAGIRNNPIRPPCPRSLS